MMSQRLSPLSSICSDSRFNLDIFDIETFIFLHMYVYMHYFIYKQIVLNSSCKRCECKVSCI